MDLINSDPLSYLVGKRSPLVDLAGIFENSPVVWCSKGYWLVGGYPECRQMTMDTVNLSVKSRNRILPWLFGMDPPEHLFARRRAHGLFSGETTTLLTALAEKRSLELSMDLTDGPTDFPESYGFALPAQVIGHLLGVRGEAEQIQFNRWVKFLMLAPSAMNSGILSFSKFDQVTRQIDAFFLSKLERYSEDDPDCPILLRWYAPYRKDGSISESDLLKFVRTLMFAGIITVSCLISNTLLNFHRNPELWPSAKSDPSLIPKVLEESLRFETPVTHSNQTTVRELKIGEVTIPANQQVIAFFAMANRDPHFFSDPNTFNPLRENTGKHLSFGCGPHACLGAHLARMIANVAFSTLTKQFSGFTLEVEEDRIEWIAATFLRGPTKLPVRFES